MENDSVAKENLHHDSIRSKPEIHIFPNHESERKKERRIKTVEKNRSQIMAIFIYWETMIDQEVCRETDWEIYIDKKQPVQETDELSQTDWWRERNELIFPKQIERECNTWNHDSNGCISCWCEEGQARLGRAQKTPTWSMTQADTILEPRQKQEGIMHECSDNISSHKPTSQKQP